MKVCDLALFASSTSSGVKTHIANKIAYITNRPDLEHVVIVPDREDSEQTQGRSKVIGVHGVRSFYPGIYIGLNLPRIARIIEHEAPDIIEVNCQYTLGWAAFLATRRRRSPVVGVYHTDVPACARHWTRHAGGTVSSAVERLVEWYEGHLYRHCTATVILHAAMRDRVARLGVSRVACLPCAVDTATFHPGRRDPALRARLGVQPDQRVILYAGRLSQEKELDLLFAAFKQLASQSFALWIAGDGPDLDAVTTYTAGRPGLNFLGHIESRAELAAVYASADIFVTPGRYETFGMSTLEAIACGLPVVGIQDSGTTPLVPETIGRLVPAGDARAMADGIRQLANCDAALSRDYNHRFAADGFSIDVVFDQYFALYRSLLTETPLRVPA